MAIDSDSNSRLNRLALDLQAGEALRSKAKSDPRTALKEAAQQFEAMFLQMVLKSMRDATPQDGLFDSDASRFYTAMHDQQLAQNLASGRGIGLARMIEEQLGRHLPTAGNLPAKPAATISSSASSAAASSTSALPATSDYGAPADAREFVNRVWPHAVEASRSTGIPPQFLVAHAALESGWGKSEIRRADGSSSHNLFGIKAGRSWTGEVAEATTTEFVAGEAQKSREPFRAYASYAESFRDYASLLRNNPRFGGVIGSQDGTEFARRLQQAGYATDPAYADKLARIINGPTLRQALIG